VTASPTTARQTGDVPEGPRRRRLARRGRTHLHAHDDSRDATQKLIRSADLEIIPLRGVESKLDTIPPGTTVTVTCSPKFGLDRTLDYAELAVNAGYRVVPHLAARQVVDSAELRTVVARLGEIGITDLYVIGGDAAEPAGDFSSAYELLQSLAAFEHGLTHIGVACYPEGHPNISDDVLVRELALKQEYATYMVSQMCFDVDTLIGWLRTTRASGVQLPLHVGLAAPLNSAKLAQLSVKIGVGASLRYLTKQHGMVSKLLRGSTYRPEELLLDIGEDLTSAELGIDGVHLFSFNQIAATVAWQNRVAGN
jgi:methylenetetrahydrofolate reductase (NADPH)